MPEQNDRIKILVVCMLDSIHTARWLSNFKDQDIDFILFPSTPNRKVHPKLKKMLKESKSTTATFKTNLLLSKFSVAVWGIGVVSNLLFPAYLIKKIIEKNKISTIHAIELNHAGYLVSKAFALGIPNNIRIIATNWGSDIYWFGQFPSHAKKIRQILEISNFYSAECTRDLELATQFGFTGSFFEVLPNTGGFSFDELNSPQKLTSSRKAIVVKGYESFVGRASIALKAIQEVSDLLIEYKIYIYSANRKTIKLAKKLKKKTNLDVVTFPKKSLTHQEVLEIFRNSRIYIGVSLSDAISTSLLESMVCGTYPIQTNTSCADEWILSGVSGSIVAPDVFDVSRNLRLALNDNELVDNAAKINRETALKKLDSGKIKKKLANFYLS